MFPFRVLSRNLNAFTDDDFNLKQLYKQLATRAGTRRHCSPHLRNSLLNDLNALYHRKPIKKRRTHAHMNIVTAGKYNTKNGIETPLQASWDIAAVIKRKYTLFSKTFPNLKLFRYSLCLS